MDPRPPERLVRVDVPHAGDPLLRQQERLDRRPPAARQGAQRVGGEVVAERLHAEPGGEVLVAGVGAEQDDAGAEAPHVREHQALAGVQVHADAGVAGAPPAPEAEKQVARHPQVHHEEDLVLELEHAGTCRAGPPPRCAGPSTASSSSTGAAGSHQRASSTSMRDQGPALEVRRQLAPDRLDLGKLGQASPAASSFSWAPAVSRTLPLSFSERSSGSKTSRLVRPNWAGGASSSITYSALRL